MTAPSIGGKCFKTLCFGIFLHPFKPLRRIAVNRLHQTIYGLPQSNIAFGLKPLKRSRRASAILCTCSAETCTHQITNANLEPFIPANPMPNTGGFRECFLPFGRAYAPVKRRSVCCRNAFPNRPGTRLALAPLTKLFASFCGLSSLAACVAGQGAVPSSGT
ncbi:hypothetical protein FF011L_37290 [Roseimaritima multifibrata]|uniref:Uncharacterized protein n=1 Tax=Roseimaritima multifibrata TaxID=1930274 RepID=A0A517MJ70_9BACT|nr:hypothetical protein FF011L_37290 [Roseimaritima multifibrata]